MVCRVMSSLAGDTQGNAASLAGHQDQGEERNELMWGGHWTGSASRRYLIALLPASPFEFPPSKYLVDSKYRPFQLIPLVNLPQRSYTV